MLVLRLLVLLSGFLFSLFSFAVLRWWFAVWIWFYCLGCFFRLFLFSGVAVVGFGVRWDWFVLRLIGWCFDWL